MQIDNLNAKSRPTFQSIFGNDWESLPPVLKKHYANHPYSDDRVTVEGKLDVKCLGFIKALKPLFLILKIIPPYTESDVPVIVHFDSEKNSKFFRFNRTFYFKKSKPYQFQSKMMQVKDNEVVEIMKFGIGWHFQCLWQDERVVLKHKGYLLRLFGQFIPLPITWLIGAGYAEEKAIDNDSFDMFVEINHPWWGIIYSYKGTFRITDIQC